MFYKNFKGIAAIVSLSLFLVVSLIGYFIVSDNTLFVIDSLEVDLQKKDLARSLEVLSVDGSNLYVRNDYSENLEINEIKVGDEICSLSESTILSLGDNVVDIDNCTISLVDLEVYDISIFTDSGVFTESELLRSAYVFENVVLSSNVTNVTYGSSINLSWTSSSVSNCVASGNWSGSKSTSGYVVFSDLVSNITFILTCDGASESVNDSIIIEVVIPSASYTSTGTRYNVNIFEDLGSPATYGNYIWINDGKIGSTSSTQPSVTTGNFAEGSNLLIINNGQIYGAGGAGISTSASTANSGGIALNISHNNTQINNTGTGSIFGGGGSGGAGYWTVCSGGHQLSMPSGGGQGLVGGANVVWPSSVTCGTTTYTASRITPDGSESAASAGGNKYTLSTGGSGTLNCAQKGCGGAGGSWGNAGSYGRWTGWGDNSPSNFDAGGAGGYSVRLNGNSVTWLEGNNAGQVKGTIYTN